MSHFEATPRINQGANLNSMLTPFDPDMAPCSIGGVNSTRAAWAGEAIAEFQMDPSGFGNSAIKTFAELSTMRKSSASDAELLRAFLHCFMHWVERHYVYFSFELSRAETQYKLGAVERFEPYSHSFTAIAESYLSDLLCNLMHWADRRDIDFQAALATAHEDYENEVAIDG